MSNASVVYEKILSEIQTLFPEKSRIPYPYSLEDNQSHFLANGYGLKVGSAEYEPLEFSNFVVARNIAVVVTREVFRTDSDEVVIDDIVKALMDDIYVVQRKLYEMDATSGNSLQVIKVDVGSVSGVQTVTSSNSKFLSMEAEFSFKITDSF